MHVMYKKYSFYEISSIPCNRTEKLIIGESAILSLGYMDSCQGLRELGWEEKLRNLFLQTCN
jgi:hypothetical protein